MNARAFSPLLLQSSPLDAGSPTWGETFDVLTSMGLPYGHVLNTGGGCLVLEVLLEGGTALWVSGAQDNVSATPEPLHVDDDGVTVGEGWAVDYRCVQRQQDGDCDHVHAFLTSEDSTYGTLVRLVTELMTAELRAAN